MAGEQMFCKRYVALERIENVLPGPNGIGMPNKDWIAGFKSADEVRNKAVFRPVSSANHVACTRSGD